MVVGFPVARGVTLREVVGRMKPFDGLAIDTFEEYRKTLEWR